ncbi:hypothetical protein SD961_19250 [Erwinia sp. MMLR14_017]|uniref:hypothetical protein n=1 Tax=Erwinia sp. MMLR14_017 TaxID=3093842 RepID=UPI00298FF16F|nr:hypothetical protein [Erwinia sp. MMLR14_017]MDW8847998.1 hypothetical protein [Erwinia sp. MMLR14_017]
MKLRPHRSGFQARKTYRPQLCGANPDGAREAEICGRRQLLAGGTEEETVPLIQSLYDWTETQMKGLSQYILTTLSIYFLFVYSLFIQKFGEVIFLLYKGAVDHTGGFE